MSIKHRALVWTGLWWTLAQVACAQDLPLTSPPSGTLFYYPMSVAAPRDAVTGELKGDKVYIVSSNFDQRFDTGWITELDVAAFHQVLTAAGGTDDDAAVRTAFKRSLKVPNLGAGMSVADQRAIIPHRGSGLLTVLDIDGSGSVHCGDSSAKAGLTPTLQRTDCDAAHLIDLVAFATAHPPPNSAFNRRDYQDPFASAILPAPGGGGALVSVGYLSSSWMSVLELPNAAAPTPMLRRHIAVGTGAVASLQPTPNDANSLTATSRKIDTTQDLSAVYNINVLKSLADNADVLTKTYVSADVGGQDIYAAAFAPDGNRLFVTNRGPDSVVALERWSPPAGGLQSSEIAANPNMRVTSAAVLDGTLPTDVVYLERGGASDLVAVAGLLTDSVYFLSPRNGVLQLVSRIKLSKGISRQDGAYTTVFSGKGPYGMVRAQRPGLYDYLVVSTFYDHGVSIIDVSGPEVLNYREVTHISEGGNLGNAQRSR